MAQSVPGKWSAAALMRHRPPRPADRAKLLADAQRLLADDAANVFLFQPQWITIAHKNVRGLWRDMPVFVNDLSALSWA